MPHSHDSASSTTVTAGIPIFPEFCASAETFSAWNERLENHLELQGITDDVQKKRAILVFVGADGFRKLLDRIKPEKSTKDLNYKEIVTVLKEIFEPIKNKWSKRSEFRKIRQFPGEALDDFENRLRHAAVDCLFSTEQLQERLIEQFTEGLDDKSIVQNLLMKANNFTRLSEFTALAATVISIRKASSCIKDNEFIVEGVNRIGQRFRSSKWGKAGPTRNMKQRSTLPENFTACYRCGGKNHLATECRYRSAKCGICNLTGHLPKVCRKKQSRQNFLEEHRFHRIASKSPLYEKVAIEGQTIQMEIDTGSEISTMPIDSFLSAYPEHPLQKNDIRLSTATGHSFQPESYAEVNVTYGNTTKNLRLYLMENASFPVLMGRAWLRELPLDVNKMLTPALSCKKISMASLKSTASNLLKKYPNLLKTGIGCIRGTEAKIELTTNPPKPLYARARPLPHSMTDLTNRELDFLEKNGVIEKVPVSEWAHPAVVVPRAQGRKVRICGDFKMGINRFIRIDEHPLKNIRHALDNIGNGKTFSKLDLSNAFLHMPVRESDRKYLVVNTHRGLYKFRRMTNGLSNAPAIWQRFIEGILAGIEGTECVIDDIIVTGSTDVEHLNDHDLRLNPDKCVFFEETVTYCGFTLKHGEIHKCTDKVEAIRRAPSPKNVSELRSFLGLIQFYATFAPSLADMASPLYELLKSDSVFKWTARAESAFNAVKEEPCSERVLVPFDPQKPLLLERTPLQSAFPLFSHIVSMTTRKDPLRSTQRSSRLLRKSTLSLTKKL